MTSFGERVAGALAAHGPLCVGIDPHEHLLAQWGLDVSAEGARELGLRLVEAAAGRVGIVKPQVAFFERYGAVGFAALEDVLSAARAAGLLVIADAKRGDIGTTMDAYARAWLTPGSPLEADALTVAPYLGVGALHETFALARDNGKGVFVLAATSNAEGAAVQLARAGTGTLAGEIVREVSEWNAAHATAAPLASVGFVIGATVDRTRYGLPDGFAPAAPVLAPGFGAQGAEPADLARLFGALAPSVIANESRSILSAGPNGLEARIAERAALYGSMDG
ncbi:orotidine-5'-phosphate decarboxylase [Microbacterium sp. X-17]|uniref:orotidine-5'-phosphate decarboxylase n=1 Tax=Microbacterium sp. X-17 TaxID=3144404 RepID=UPI0031F5D0FB